MWIFVLISLGVDAEEVTGRSLSQPIFDKLPTSFIFLNINKFMI